MRGHDVNARPCYLTCHRRRHHHGHHHHPHHRNPLRLQPSYCCFRASVLHTFAHRLPMSRIDMAFRYVDPRVSMVSNIPDLAPRYDFGRRAIIRQTCEPLDAGPAYSDLGWRRGPQAARLAACRLQSTPDAHKP